jgi:hypothetical protein
MRMPMSNDERFRRPRPSDIMQYTSGDMILVWNPKDDRMHFLAIQNVAVINASRGFQIGLELIARGRRVAVPYNGHSYMRWINENEDGLSISQTLFSVRIRVQYGELGLCLVNFGSGDIYMFLKPESPLFPNESLTRTAQPPSPYTEH